VAHLQSLVRVQATIRTERGYRVGLAGKDDALSTLAGLMPRVARCTIRPVSLDDVYFAGTQSQASGRQPREDV
jgi:hypothetical protein